MSFQINHESWHAGKSRLRLCTKFIEIINAQLDDEGNGVKVIELTAYHDWKRRAFSEASKNLFWPQTAKTRYDSTKYTASYNSHHSALEEMLNCCCCCAVIVKQPKVAYTYYRTEKSPYVPGIPQTKGRRRYTTRLQGLRSKIHLKFTGDTSWDDHRFDDCHSKMKKLSQLQRLFL